MLGGRDVYDGIETLWGANWTHLGQKSSVNIADAVSQGTAGYSEVTDFLVFLHHSRQRLVRHMRRLMTLAMPDRW